MDSLDSVKPCMIDIVNIHIAGCELTCRIFDSIFFYFKKY